MKNIIKRLFDIAGWEIRRKPNYNTDQFAAQRNVIQNEKPLIFDIGANIGQTAVKYRNYFPDAIIHSFEPVPELYRILSSKAKKSWNIYAYPLALGDFVGKAKFYVSEIFTNQPSASSSLLAPKEHLACAPHVSFKQEIEVNVTTIDAWAADHGVDAIDFMWLDMQGYELNALMAAPRILKTVSVILTEVEFVEAYEGQYLYADVKEFLEQQGFTLIATNFLPWYGDAIFARLQ